MLEDLERLSQLAEPAEKQSIFISKYALADDGGTRSLFEAQFYRETRLAEEKKNSNLLNITLDKLIKAIAK